MCFRIFEIFDWIHHDTVLVEWGVPKRSGRSVKKPLAQVLLSEDFCTQLAGFVVSTGLIS